MGAFERLRQTFLKCRATALADPYSPAHSGFTPIDEEGAPPFVDVDDGEDGGDPDQDEPGPSRPWQPEGGPKRLNLYGEDPEGTKGSNDLEGMLDPDDIYHPCLAD